MVVLDEIAPDWRQKKVLEFAPYGAVSCRLQSECSAYRGSVYRPDLEPGSEVKGYLNQDLRALTLPDNDYDIVISQDVFEHVFEPQRGFAEIGRILRPGGVHIFTIPYHRAMRTRPRALLDGDRIEHLLEPEYHGDPNSASGALVVTDWGNDLEERVFEASGLQTTLFNPQNGQHGIVGEYLEVFVSGKPPC